MRFRSTVIFVVILIGLIFARPAQADGDPPSNPLRQPRSQSPYGMDLMGPGWQWTFPREEAWPRLDGDIRVDLLDEMVQGSWAAGVRSARFATWWCMTEPERDSYDWEPLDYAFQIASNYGIVPVPQIYYTPDWAALGGDVETHCVSNEYPRNLPPQDMDDWSDFMAAIVGRYGAYGKDQVHEWEIWNEPDLWEFWYIPWDPAKANAPMYSLMVQRAKEQIVQHDINGRLLLGGVSDINGPGFLKRLMKLDGEFDLKEDVDVVAFHVFSDHIRKIDALKDALGDNNYELWVTELNYWGWSEHESSQRLADFYDLLAQEGIVKSFWFVSWTTDWGPSIFLNRAPIWEPKPFTPSPFYDTFKQQAFTHTLPQAPIVQEPADGGLVDPLPTFVWERPAEGDFAIAGYKLQVDNSLFRGKPYFHSPELDVWVPGAELHFLPFQMIGENSATAVKPASSVSPAPPSIPRVRYQSVQDLPQGLYYWRVAAVDVQGNVGPYTPARTILVSVGKERVFLPAMIQP